MPTMEPKVSCEKIFHAMLPVSPAPTRPIPITVSMYDIGSLLPLSISRSEAVPSFKLSFFCLNMEKTLAASVDERTAPIKKLSAIEKRSTK